MPSVKVYNLEGSETGSVELDGKIFAVAAPAELMYQVVRVMELRQREPWAHTKDRGDVAGGGRKPWKQKGTGRARHGSIRSPLWKGGGVTFGPRKESFTLPTVPRKMVKKALKAALSDRVRSDEGFMILEDAKIEKPSTKTFANFLSKRGLGNGKVLFLLESGMESARRSIQNLPEAQSIHLENLNILDILKAKHIVINRQSIEKLAKQLA